LWHFEKKSIIDWKTDEAFKDEEVLTAASGIESQKANRNTEYPMLLIHIVLLYDIQTATIHTYAGRDSVMNSTKVLKGS